MTLQVAVLGLGLMGVREARILDNTSNVSVVAGADPDPEARSKFKSQFGKSTYQSGEELLDDLAETVDAAIVATPHADHYAQTKQALEAGIDLLVEKPLATTRTEIADLVNVEAASDATILVGYHRQFNPAYRRMHNAVANGTIGEVKSVSASIGQSWVMLNRGKWRMDPERGGIGGCLFDTGSHLLEGLLWVVDGTETHITAETETHGAEIITSAQATIRFARDGVPCLGSITVCGESTDANVDERIQLVGTNGRLEYTRDKRTDGPDERLNIVTGGETESFCEPRTHSELTHKKVQHFVDVCRDEASPCSGSSVALRVSKLREAIAISGRHGRRITLDEFEDSLS